MRLTDPPAPELIHSAYARELADATILYEGMSLADLAHVVGLAETGVVRPEASGQLLRALLSIHPRPPLDFALDPATGDLYSNRQAHLSLLTPHAAYLGAGRARREAATIAYRIAVRSRLLSLAAALMDCAGAACEQAEAHIATLFPDYTYLQPAQPTSFGHYLLTFVYPILRDLDRLRTAFVRTNASPAGSGSVNGTRLPLDRLRLAELLGFDTVIPHTRDAMWQADGPIELAALLAAALVNLDRLGEDLQVFATHEFGLVELADRHSRPSVIMPQKKNPYSLAYVRGAAGEALGTLAAMAAVGKTPSGQPDNRIFAYGVLPRALDQSIGVARLMAGVLGGLMVNVERAAERAGAGFAGATDLAEALMLETGLDYGTAHNVVGRAVRNALDAREVPPSITSEGLASAAQALIGRRLELSSTSLASAVDPAAIVASRTGPGGAARSSIADMLAEIRLALDDHRQWRQACELRLDQAVTGLLVRAASLARPPTTPAPPEGEEHEKTMGDLLSELPDPRILRGRFPTD